MPARSPLAAFSGPARAWFSSTFEEPTPAQSGAWEAIASGKHTLVVAPTGSGKTLAAFLWSLDRLMSAPPPEKDRRLRVVYVSPLKALAVDIERNLRAPLAGIKVHAPEAAVPLTEVSVAIRTGDTPAEDRRAFAKHPPDILITTPESLFLLLTSQARDVMRHVDSVIVDEVHAVAGNKRGAHLALSLERLDELLPQPAQRIGLSATVRPVEEVARWLNRERPVRVVQPKAHKDLDLTVVVPVEDMANMRESAATLETRSIWPSVEHHILELIRAHRSTIVFANSRRLAERLCARLNEEAGETIARAHHGSVSREQRLGIEEELKAGRLPCVVATSSLELGIDMGAVDLVVQVEAPTSVASGMQRIGRAGHRVGATSRGIFFPKFRGDLLQSAVVVERMREGAIEALRGPRNPLDVLSQQIVAMVAMDDWTVDRLEKVVRRAASFEDLPRSALESVLDMLSGRYPSDEFAELRPRITWDRIDGRLSARPGAQRLAVTSGGTIPDRGLYGVFLSGDPGTAARGSTRVGELDEEMVYESRVGEVFILGATSWRIEDITRDRVLVSPAPGVPGKMPFWKADAPGRPLELGRAVGAFTRRLAAMKPDEARRELHTAGLDRLATENLLRYLAGQKEATGVLPDDRTIVVERFHDELGDWRVCVHTPFGAQVHAPWAQAIEARLRERLGIEVATMYSDDGIVIHVPDADRPPATDALVLEPGEVEDAVVANVGTSALFASRFRECAARALLLPRRRPGQRTPLWQQRRRSASLLQVASKYGSFPILLEAMRECLQDVFDVPALRDLMAAIERREVRVVEVETPAPSPFATSLNFGYIANYLYEGDAPLAERRAQALTLDRKLLAELLGTAELRELIDPGALADLELDLQRLADAKRIRDADDLHDALRLLGDLTAAEAEARGGARAWLDDLERSHRALRARVAGEERWLAGEDASRYRDALGTAPPPGVPGAFLEPVADPLGDLVARYARTHGPFREGDVAARLGLGAAAVLEVLRRLAGEGRVAAGEFRPGGAGREWVDVEVLRSLRRRSLAAFRREAEPVAPETLGRFLPAWQEAGAFGRPMSLDALLRVIEQLAGAAVPASALEHQVLGARLAGYLPAGIDQLAASGELVWAGAGAIGNDDGWVAICPTSDAPLLLPPADAAERTPTAGAILEVLRTRGAVFFRQIVEAVGSLHDREVLEALWELVWAGEITNDTLAPLRAYVSGGGLARARAYRRRRGPVLPVRLGPAVAGGRWSALPEREPDHTRRAHAIALQLLKRHGIVVRGSIAAERAGASFADLYAVLKATEESGRCRRGYFVEGLGGAQFGLGGAVERLRAAEGSQTLVLAATDPANPYGAALPWPAGDADAAHRAGRKAGASVVLTEGILAAYLEKGGRTLLVFDPDLLGRAADALAEAARGGVLGPLAIERVNGARIATDSAPAEALRRAGFVLTPKGFRLRAESARGPAALG